MLTTVAIMNLEKEGYYGVDPPEWLRNLFIEVLPGYLGMDCRPKEIRRKNSTLHWMEPGEVVLICCNSNVMFLKRTFGMVWYGMV